MKIKQLAVALFCFTVGTMVAQVQGTIRKSSIAQQEKNKQLATTAYQRIFGDLDITAVDDYMSKEFLQHNPTIADGPEGVKALVQMLVSQGIPKQKIEFKHIIAEGDIVILHSRYEMAGKEWRFIDIYRIENNKLVEHWDANMAMPDERANNNTLF